MVLQWFCSGSAHKEKSPIDCAEQSIRDQWKEIRIKKHNEFLYLKSREKKVEESQERLSRQSSSDSKQKIQSNSSTKYNSKRSTNTGEAATIAKEVDKSKGSKRNKRKIQQRSIKATYRESESKNESTKKIMLLGNSHIRRLDGEKILRWPIVAKGIGGIKSDQPISRHKQTIKSELQKFDEVIIHVRSNDISRGISTNKLIANVDMAGQRLQEMKHDVKITLSSIFLQGYDPPKKR